jgi:hypothetical protein
MSIETWMLITTLVGGIATLSIFSFFVKENSFYRFFEHLYIGISAGFGPIYTLKYFLWPKVLAPMLGYTIVMYPDGTVVNGYEAWSLWYIAPLCFGLLYYTVFSARYSWMVKLVIGFALGASATLAFKGFFNEMMPQLVGSMKPLLVFGDGGFDLFLSLRNLVFVATLLLVLNYFFFTFKREASGVSPSLTAGRWLLMICFGSFFGSTVMARLALLVERLQFLYSDWLLAVIGLVKGVA